MRPKSEGNVIEMMTASRTEGFGEEVKRRIILGTYVLSSGYTISFGSHNERFSSAFCRTLFSCRDHG
jgi:Asp-tRNA(Asn)/Glu-tRNA(Gln) amidotransferase A subunit family amidase